MNQSGIISTPGSDRRAIPQDAREDHWTAPDGYAIRRIDFAQPSEKPRGSMLFLPGRGDAYEKYLETLEHWNARGWQVTSMDWRGQAGSGRLGFDPVTGHVGDFAIWVDDLARFWASWAASAISPKVLIAHSMGGHLALRALAEHRIKPDAVVLSAPMLGLPNKGVPSAVLHFVARIMNALGDPRRPAWKWNEKPGEVPEDRFQLLTHDEDRYADELWWRDNRPELVMGPGSWGWVEQALASMHRLEEPGLLEGVQTAVYILATSADRLVDYGAIQRAAHRLPNAELETFGAESAHEILREVDAVRDKALTSIDDFLDRVAPHAD